MEKVVIFLGFTGSGKSTVAKFILKDPTLKIKEDMQV
jgi:adenylate kinase family enzyme